MLNEPHDPFLTLGNNYPTDMMDNNQMFSKKNQPLTIEEGNIKMEQEDNGEQKNVTMMNGFINDAENDYFFGWGSLKTV